ncbi:probable ATP-dependent RNA helicase ddx52 [Arvicola amphibius]|uniref:probable ATP-dependent RNA helicase ddx52 n=1 Tax=Arvicola amphibius TaxID=1047088 RepID=UPI0018E3D85F|nr:probable ATP-dependent RNA helicase ddx52 [Arvicola amphibius]XP_038173362.1 probable ATP-dependent RNA helicase ddx52 [Arvicola amphibius]
MLYNQERSPSPTDQAEVGRQLGPFLFVDEDGFVPEEYVNLIPENLIPMALEAEMEGQLVVEDGDEIIWFHVQHMDFDEEEEEENQAEVMEEDNGWVHNVEENNEDDDEANHEHTEIITGTGSDHMYERSHDETKEAAVAGKVAAENESQEEEDDNTNSTENKD